MRTYNLSLTYPQLIAIQSAVNFVLARGGLQNEHLGGAWDLICKLAAQANKIEAGQAPYQESVPTIAADYMWIADEIELLMISVKRRSEEQRSIASIILERLEELRGRRGE